MTTDLKQTNSGLAVRIHPAARPGETNIVLDPDEEYRTTLQFNNKELVAALKAEKVMAGPELPTIELRGDSLYIDGEYYDELDVVLETGREVYRKAAEKNQAIAQFLDFYGQPTDDSKLAAERDSMAVEILGEGATYASSTPMAKVAINLAIADRNRVQIA